MRSFLNGCDRLLGMGEAEVVLLLFPAIAVTCAVVLDAVFR